MADSVTRTGAGRRLAAAFCAAVIAWGVPGDPRPASARADPPAVKAAKTRLRRELHELASWCAGRKLFAARHDVYELVIEIWPEDEVARKWNGYARDPGGGWLPSTKKRPRNLAAGALPALREMQSRIARDYLEAVAQAVREEPGGEAAALRGQALRYAVRIAPDDAKMRQRNGEVPGRVEGRKGKWILIETKRSRERRPALRAAAEKALAGIPKPVKTAPRALDRHSSVHWAHGYEGPGRASSG